MAISECGPEPIAGGKSEIGFVLMDRIFMADSKSLHTREQQPEFRFLGTAMPCYVTDHSQRCSVPVAAWSTDLQGS